MSDELKESIAKILQAAKENNKSSGIYSVSGDQARGFADQGFNMVSKSCIRMCLNISSNIGLDLCHDGCGGASPGYDCGVDGGKGLIRPFCIKHRKRSHVRIV